ncbi:MAG TPA: hypothetical protein VLG25_01645 [Patescibacteria group bacterium]|nr:hypothetical protein [Patescibacteria group bacterium]
MTDTVRRSNKINRGQFQKGDKRASEAGKRGAAAQPIAAKRLGGKHSHMNMK